tara:strand:- start:451 stop:945 length:495 start_codon:yes stop_codon:yes gene_type:complete
MDDWWLKIRKVLDRVILNHLVDAFNKIRKLCFHHFFSVALVKFHPSRHIFFSSGRVVGSIPTVIYIIPQVEVFFTELKLFFYLAGWSFAERITLLYWWNWTDKTSIFRTPAIRVHLTLEESDDGSPIRRRNFLYILKSRYRLRPVQKFERAIIFSVINDCGPPH